MHRKSGIPKDKISELHGNRNIEYCSKCGTEFYRDFRCRTALAVHDHKTGRSCEQCGGDLLDNIINFDEGLPERDLTLAFEHAEQADLCIALGSSLTVTPAADIPEQVGLNKSAKLVIVNLQKTPMDKLCDLRFFNSCDTVMEKLLAKMNLKIPKFFLQRYIEVKTVTRKNKKFLTVQDVEDNGKPCTVLKMVIFEKRYILKTRPYELAIPCDDMDTPVRIAFHFFGNHKENTVNIDHIPRDKLLYNLKFNPRKIEWEVKSEAIPKSSNNKVASK